MRVGDPGPQFPAVAKPRVLAQGNWIHERLVDKVVAGEGRSVFSTFPLLCSPCPGVGAVFTARTLPWIMGVQVSSDSPVSLRLARWRLVSAMNGCGGFTEARLQGQGGGSSTGCPAPACVWAHGPVWLLRGWHSRLAVCLAGLTCAPSADLSSVGLQRWLFFQLPWTEDNRIHSPCPWASYASLFQPQRVHAPQEVHLHKDALVCPPPGRRF